VSIQGLYRFYERRTERVVAGWMTRQDRELAIADNITYVSRVLKHVLDGRAVDVMVFAGFSQGVAMAFRAAVSAAAQRHVIARRDVPQNSSTELHQLSSVMICRGWKISGITDIFAMDVRRLKEAGLLFRRRSKPVVMSVRGDRRRRTISRRTLTAARLDRFIKLTRTYSSFLRRCRDAFLLSVRKPRSRLGWRSYRRRPRPSALPRELPLPRRGPRRASVMRDWAAATSAPCSPAQATMPPGVVGV
jgi:hypothetical protein